MQATDAKNLIVGEKYLINFMDGPEDTHYKGVGILVSTSAEELDGEACYPFDIGPGLHEASCLFPLSSITARVEHEMERPRHDSMPRLVVCAAIRHKDTHKIICGARHGHCLNTAVSIPGYESEVWELGFIDQHNTFMTREEAWGVADAAGQIRRPTGYERHYNDARQPGVGDKGLLFSENLY